jgi:hypothetical protein
MDQIYDDLVHALGTEVIADSTVTKYSRSANFVPKKDGTLTNPQTSSPVPSIMPSQQLLLNVHFRLCTSFPEGIVFLAGLGIGT